MRLYLPGADDGLQPEPVAAAIVERKGGESVIVVEDQDFVRSLPEEFYGYSVLETADADEAQALVEKHSGQIHLLLTEVILRGINGKRLSEMLLLLRPKLRVLFMSGYPADVISSRGILEPGVTYIQKPFTPAGLAAKVREALSGDE